MTPSCGGWRNSEVGYNKGDVKGNNNRKLKKSAELFAVLEFLRNLRDTGVGTNQTETIARNINDEINAKVGAGRNNNDEGHCHRDVDLIRNIMDIRISKLAKLVRESKREMRNETNRIAKKVNNPQEIMREREKIGDEILTKER